MNEYEEIANCLLPNRVTVQYGCPPTGDRARYNYAARILQAPRPTDPRSLWNFLHECAHATLHTDRSVFGSVPRQVTEYECERWTRDRFAEKKIPSDELMQESSGYLKREIMLDLVEVVDRGLDQRALQYLLPLDRSDLLESVDKHLRSQSGGVVTWATINPYAGPVTSEEDFGKSYCRS